MNNKLLQWKSTYGSVYQINIEGHSIIYRALNAWELQALTELRENKTSNDLELSTCLLAILEPTPLPNFKKPGSISSISAAIWKQSTPSAEEVQTKVEDIRQWAEVNINTNFNIALSSIICKVFPSIDLTTLLNLSLPQLLKVGAIVEKITGVQFLTGDASSFEAQRNLPDAANDQASVALGDALKQLKNKK